MDDFLHNLRSGKLKQHDRSNRSYNDPQYKGGPRRGAVDRRKKGSDSSEQMNAIKELLESVSETQKRIAAAEEARAKSEERKAMALEVIADRITEIFGRTAPDGQGEASRDAAEPLTEPIVRPHRSPDAADSTPDQPEAGKLGRGAKQQVFSLIEKMRVNGSSWEKIARNIAAQGYPTVSGKGRWRGVMAKNLYEKMAAE